MQEKWKKERELRKQICILKSKLKQTDYQAIKYAEGVITLNDYIATKEKRNAWRAEINALEAQIKALGV